MTLFPESIDYFISRFLPFPLDLRSLVYGFKVEGGTPFLETQTNVPLGIFWIWLAYAFSNRDRFLKNPSRATHFNPVFVCAELPKDPNYYDKNQSSFWLMAKKQWQ